jgi:general secretion pathway protein F
MPAFAYQALTAQGKKIKGVLESDSLRQARNQLRERGLLPLEVLPTAEKQAKNKGSWLQPSVSAADLALLTRQMATLIQANLPVEEALFGVAEQNDKPALKSLMLALRAKVKEGYSLAQALRDFPHVFNDLYCATVEAGQESGSLDLVLERLADYTEARQALQQRISLALFYPGLLTLMAIGVVFALLTYVVPEVVKVFDNIGQNLPPLTQGLIAVSAFFQNYALYLIAAIVALLLILRQLWKNPAIRRRWQALLLHLPIIGTLERAGNTSRFARTFSMLMSAGVTGLQSLKISGQVMNNLPMQDSVAQAAQKVSEGSSFARALAERKIFPPMLIQLIASGERSGTLPDMLERGAKQQERELEGIIATVLGLFEPLLILVMGGIVLVIVIAILLPIFELNQLVG